MNKILILGATSEIAQHTARKFAEEGCSFFLVARNRDRLETVAQDLRVRGAKDVAVHVADLVASGSHAAIFQMATKSLTSLDIVFVAYGTLPDQKTCESSFEAAQLAIDTNFTSVVSWLTLAANYFEKEKRGTIAVLSSVAGDRGRKSNYVYGASKGALSILLQGLRNRLYSSGVAVLTIKPGFVDTPMTAHLKKGFLFAKPETVGKKIHRAIVKRKDVVYVPYFWRGVMLLIKLVPESAFKKTSF